MYSRYLTNQQANKSIILSLLLKCSEPFHINGIRRSKRNREKTNLGDIVLKYIVKVRTNNYFAFILHLALDCWL